MATSDMLRQAIADAKIIKETAIANAKNALEEAFTPKLKELLSEKIEEMDMEEEMEEGMHYEEEMHEEDAHEGKEEMHEGDMEEETSEPHGNIGQHTPEGEPLGFLEGDMEEEMTEEDLEEMLKEMEKEMHEGEEVHEEETHEEKEIHEGEMGEGEEMHEEKEEMHEEVSDEDLMDLIKDVVKSMADAGELEGVEVEFDEAETEEEAEEEETEEPETEEEAEEEETEELAEIMRENAELKETVEYLTTQLNEINVLNAKLLYVNKIFKAKNLSESRKVKLLSQFDGASSIKEVKLVYNTVVANLAEETKVTKKSSLKEGVGRASKPSGVSSRKPIVNVDPTVSRFQKLAGIK